MLIIECLRSLDGFTDIERINLVESVLMDFGLEGASYDTPQKHYQEYGKLVPTDHVERTTFILAMTDRFRVYSLGRFGTWRQILLDDLAKDIRIIERMITERDDYGRRLNWRTN